MDKEVTEILHHIADGHNFLLSGGAGSGKTHTLVETAKEVIRRWPTYRIACITYTNAAADEIERRVNHNALRVSTIHDFLWNNIKNYQRELRLCLAEMHNDNGCKF